MKFNLSSNVQQQEQTFSRLIRKHYNLFENGNELPSMIFTAKD